MHKHCHPILLGDCNVQDELEAKIQKGMQRFFWGGGGGGGRGGGGGGGGKEGGEGILREMCDKYAPNRVCCRPNCQVKTK